MRMRVRGSQRTGPTEAREAEFPVRRTRVKITSLPEVPSHQVATTLSPERGSTVARAKRGHGIANVGPNVSPASSGATSGPNVQMQQKTPIMVSRLNKTGVRTSGWWKER